MYKHDRIKSHNKKGVTRLSRVIDVERGLVTKLLETKDMMLVKDLQIKPFFFSGESRRVFDYIEKYYMENSEIPTVRLVKQTFPQYEMETYVNSDVNEVIGTEEPLKYWCNEVRKRVKHNKLADITEELATKLENFDSEGAYDVLKKTVLYLENEVIESNAVDITKDTKSRKELYLERKRNKGMIGIPMGIDKLDFILKGMQSKQLITMIASTGLGKANPLSTLVLTPTGFIPMRNIEKGSTVIGEDGKPYPVTDIHPQGEIDVYEVTFNDGTTSRCSKDHLWKFKTVDDLARDNEWRVDTLENIMKLKLRRGKSYNIHIPVNKAVEYAHSEELPLDPYVMGVLLGDAHFGETNIDLVNPEKDIIKRVIKRLPKGVELSKHNTTKDRYGVVDRVSRTNRVKNILEGLGLDKKRSTEKYIPREYLHSSIEERRELLKGLFDTDGHINARGSYSYYSSSEKLIEDLMYLVRSLGYRCTKSVTDRTKEGHKNLEYRITISTEDIIFTSEKHRERYDNQYKSKRKTRYNVMKIVGIEYVGKEECQCITVGSEDRTYLVDSFIVTHNTFFQVVVGSYAMLNNYRVLQLVTEMSEEQVRDRYEAMLYGITKGDFSYSRFKSGLLTPEEEDGYFDFLDNTMPKLEPLIIETASGVSNVAAMIDKYEPDLVMVDSAYLMEDDRGSDQDWLRIAHITRDLKQLAKLREIPIFINSQADNNTSRKTGPELGNIGYSRAIGADSDVVLALFRDEQMLEDNEMQVKVLKQREGTLGNVMMNWDFNTMDFSAIYSTSDDPRNKSDGDIKENLIEL